MSIENDPWDAIESASEVAIDRSSERLNRLEVLAEEYAQIKREHDALATRLGQVENEIAHLFPEEAGELAQSTKDFDVVVSRSERWTWDKSALEKLFSQEELPDYVKRSLSVDKRKFSKLPQYEQEKLRFALTRKLDNPKVRVIPHV